MYSSTLHLTPIHSYSTLLAQTELLMMDGRWDKHQDGLRVFQRLTSNLEHLHRYNTE